MDLPENHSMTIAAGQVSISGRLFMTDARGAHVPIDAVKTQHRLEDEVVRKILGYAEPLAAEIARFKAHTFHDVDSFMSLMEQEYSARGGQKGNLTLTSYDGLLKVQVQVAEQVAFGPELQIAKGLIDECIGEWAADSGKELRVLVNGAFDVDAAGRINHGRLMALTRYEIADPRWLRAMAAIHDAAKVVGSKRYVRMYRRATPKAAWEAVSLDVAAS